LNLTLLIPYQNAQVRDLVWVMAAPNLLADADWLVSDAECLAWLDAARPQLLILDAHPEPLIAWIAQSSPQRLGRYFEVLLGYWIAHLMPATWFATNRIVKTGRLVLGEYDLLWRDQRGALQHWEASVKFYLQINPDTGYAGYIGTMTRDRLDLKVAHLRDKQLHLAKTPEGSANLPIAHEPVQARALLKGWLFYPANTIAQPASGLSEQHLQAWWVRWGQLNIPQGLRWRILPRLAWFSPAITLDSTSLLNESDFVLHLVEHFSQHQTPVLASGLIQQNEVWLEHTRGFIVSSRWLSDDNR
jgi:hypothetical protein